MAVHPPEIRPVSPLPPEEPGKGKEQKSYWGKMKIPAIIGGMAVGTSIIAGAILGNQVEKATNNNNGPAPGPDTNTSAPEIPGQSEQPISSETEAPVTPEQPSETLEFQTPELEERYNEIVEAVRVPVDKYPDAVAAYNQFSTHLENWVSLKSTQEEDEKYFDYASERQIGNNGSAGVIKDIDREAYVNTMFADGNGGAFAEEINQINDMLLGNYGQTYFDETPYHLTYTLVENTTQIAVGASENQLATTIARYHYQDNVDSNSVIGQARIADGFEPTINEKHSVYMELIVVGEGADAEWKIQSAQITEREKVQP